MTCAECGAALREVEPDESPLDVVVEHYRTEHATADQYAFLLEDG